MQRLSELGLLYTIARDMATQPTATRRARKRKMRIRCAEAQIAADESPDAEYGDAFPPKVELDASTSMIELWEAMDPLSLKCTIVAMLKEAQDSANALDGFLINVPVTWPTERSSMTTWYLEANNDSNARPCEFRVLVQESICGA